MSQIRMFNQLLKTQASSRKVGIEVESHLIIDGVPVNAMDLFPEYSKENHFRVRGVEFELGTFHPDNALLERTTAPSIGGNDIAYYLCSVDGAVFNYLREHRNLLQMSTPGGINISQTAIAAAYPADQMEDGSLWFGGCDPSQNAYSSDTVIPVPEYPDTTRFGGLHLNVDTDGTHHEDLARFLDRVLGIPDVLLSSRPEEGALRRKFYGRPGEFRTKEFGIEYRVLPNTAMYLGASNNYTHRAVAPLVDMFYKNHPLVRNVMTSAADADVQQCLTTYDKPLASQLSANFLKELL